MFREGGEDGDSQGDGSSQPDTISIASRTSQNTVDSDKVGNHTHRAAVDILWVEGRKRICKQLIMTRSVARDELMTHSCLSATGSPMQLQWTEAGAVHVPVAERLSLCTFGSVCLLKLHRNPTL